jgi:hypothetical protein
LLDVGQEEIARGVRLSTLTAQDDFLTPGTAPLRRDEWQLVEDAVAGEIFFEALIDDDVGRHDEEISREF